MVDFQFQPNTLNGSKSSGETTRRARDTCSLASWMITPTTQAPTRQDRRQTKNQVGAREHSLLAETIMAAGERYHRRSAQESTRLLNCPEPRRRTIRFSSRQQSNASIGAWWKRDRTMSSRMAPRRLQPWLIRQIPLSESQSKIIDFDTFPIICP